MKSARIPCFILIATFTFAQAPAPASQVEQIVRDAMAKQQIPAMSVAVAENDRIIYSRAFGTADVENNIPATTETLFRTGSIVKSISAVAAMTLVASGKLDLDTPIQKYCPAFPQKQWTITTRELLSHTSGIRHYKNDEMNSTRHYKIMSEGFSIFANEPLLFEPGTKMQYSTYGYTVVGCVIEGASGEKFPDYLAEHVLRPAGMTHTFVDDVFTIVPHRARGYHNENGRVENAGLMDSSYKLPGGGYVSTPEDLVRFADALMDGKLIPANLRDQMWTAYKLPDGKETGYGLGFGVFKIGSLNAVGHGGGQQGTTTDMLIIPARHLAVAVMANMDDASPVGDAMKKIAETFLKTE
jgi:CubicO group peptidase (beta-lactamase class C family)